MPGPSLNRGPVPEGGGTGRDPSASLPAHPSADAALVSRAIATRAATALVTLGALLVLCFGLLHLAPGDIASLAEDPSLSQEDRARLRAALGLDRPAWAQFASYVAHAARGDLGISLTQHRPVRDVLLDALGPTLLLTGSALVLAFTLGWAVGTRAAQRPRGWCARGVRTLLPALDAMPPFWLGLAAILVFAWKLPWLPAGHMRDAALATGGLAGALDIARHLVLPVLVLALPGAAPVARHQWAAMRRELSLGYVVAARALGVPEARLVWRRAARAALQPAIALVGLALPSLVGGAVVVEVVFSWPGLGRVHQTALLSGDVPLALGGLLVIGAFVVAGGIAADLLAMWADPRLRGGNAETGQGA